MTKRCFLCGLNDSVLDFGDEAFKNCSLKLAFRKLKGFKYNDVVLNNECLDIVGYHTTCYKKVTVLSKKYTEEFNNFITPHDEIKCEPLFESQSSMDADNDSDDYIEPEPDNKSNIDENNGMDPLNTVLNSDSGSIQENSEVIRLKIQLLKYKLETEKLKRKRIEDLIQADAVERESKARESSLKLRTARLEAIAAEMKLPPSHPALAYTAEETRAQHYIHQYHAP